MSFASEVKNELSRTDAEKKCCQLAEIAGFLRVSGSIGLAGGGRFKIIITFYTYRLGILEGQYSYTTAAGLFTAVIGFAFTYAANKISNKLTGFGLW